MNVSKKSFILVLILIVAVVLRVYRLGQNPFGFFCDEASIGYNAYQILNHGTDDTGKHWPLFFESFGDFKNPVFIYSAVPIISVLGLNEFSIRITSVIFGILAIIAIYLYTNQRYGTVVALLSALFLSISPWHIHFSRVGFELISSVFLVIFWLYLFDKSFKDSRYYPLSCLFFILSFFSYTTPKLYLVPLLFCQIIFNFRLGKQLFCSRLFLFSNIIVIILVGLLLYQPIKDGSFFARWHQVTDSKTTITSIATGYLNHFSPDFLFKVGDIDFKGQFITRHSVRGLGELYWFQLPLLMLFIFKLFSHKRDSKDWFLLAFLAIYPLGSMFTGTNPQATRSIIGVAPFQIMSAIGFAYLIDSFTFIKNKIIVIILLALAIISSVFTFVRLLDKYPLYSSDYWGWQAGARQIMSYFVNRQTNYDQLCLEGKFNAPDIFIKFYDPADNCFGKCQICDYHAYNPDKKQLFAISAETYDKLRYDLEFQTQRIITYPDNTPSFYIGIINHQIDNQP